MSSDVDPREARLPKWAQRELVRLRADLAYVRGQIDEMQSVGETDSDVYVVDYVGGDRPLPRGSRILFRIGGGIVRAQATTRGGRAVVELMAGSSPLWIEPAASNVVHVWESRP